MTDSDSDSDCSNCDDSFDLFNEIGGNEFAFEPEYSAEEVKERLRAHDEVDTDDDLSTAEDDEEVEGWCTCKQCVDMQSAAERLCCQSIAGTIGRKFDSEKCISVTVAFQDVCLNKKY